MLEKLKSLDADTQALLEPHIESLIEDVKPLVKKIEAGIKTTRGNYGRYMSAFSQFGAKEEIMLLVVGCAMERAGGDRQGINDAAKIVNG